MEAQTDRSMAGTYIFLPSDSSAAKKAWTATPQVPEFLLPEQSVS